MNKYTAVEAIDVFSLYPSGMAELQGFAEGVELTVLRIDDVIFHYDEMKAEWSDEPKMEKYICEVGNIVSLMKKEQIEWIIFDT